ncbi:MAG: DUF4469 domain-containing protein [Treponema sp.]|nr:DUF4469 domain-containing protein [Treponema sp.]
MAQIEQEFTNSSNKVSVSIQKSSFSEKETFFGRVSRNTVNIDNMISSICEKVPSYDKYELKRFAKDLKAEIKSSIANGKSVNLLDLGILYIALSGGMKVAPKTASEVSSLTVKFSPSKSLTESVSKIEIDKIVYVSTAPLISNVECLWDEAEEGSVFAGKIVRITGNRLKIEGESGGAFFCPLDANMEPVMDESKWIKASVTHNLPKTVELYAPETLEKDANYAVCIKTRPNSENVYSLGFSDIVTVA